MSDNGVGVSGRPDRDHPEAVVERAIHLGLADSSQPRDQIEDRRHRPATAIDDNLHTWRDYAGKILHEPAAGDVRDGMDHALHAVMH